MNWVDYLLIALAGAGLAGSAVTVPFQRRRRRSAQATPQATPQEQAEITRGGPGGDTVLTTRPGATRPDTARSGATRPDTTRPDATRPGATRPGSGRPGVLPPTVPPQAPPPSGVEVPEAVLPEAGIETPEPTAGRLVRLRTRLSRSQNLLGKGLLAMISRDHLDDEAWEELEDTLISADVGVDATREIVDRIRGRSRVLGTRSTVDLRGLVAAELVAALDPDLDRSIHATPHDGNPAVVLVVGVNGSGKTTTCGKIARVLVADGHSVVLGAADTFRAAAADQLETWGSRVGAATVRGKEGGDPAAVAFDAVRRGIETGVDSVLIDTAGRLQNKVGLMDELRKVKRVVERHGPIDETLLIIDATTGQNGLEQARVFTDAVDVTGVVLSKLDGTAKGGIVIAVQRKLGIPVKLVGLGEGSDDLAPFDPEQFVDALLGD